MTLETWKLVHVTPPSNSTAAAGEGGEGGRREEIEGKGGEGMGTKNYVSGHVLGRKRDRGREDMQKKVWGGYGRVTS